MTQKILAFAVAAAMAAPMAAHADVKLSGTIQAEAGGAQIGRVSENEKSDRLRITKDSSGALHNGGPNNITLDIDENLGSFSAMARYQADFNTAVNGGLGKGKEAWLGLKSDNGIWFKFGTLTSAYKASKGLIDPFGGTSIQARGSAGGMSGSSYNAVTRNGTMIGKDGKLHNVAGSTLAGQSTNHFGLTHSSYIKNALELGGDFQGFSAKFQGFFDETDIMEGGGSLELRYTDPGDMFTVFAAASYTDLKDLTNKASVDRDKRNQTADGLKNWKVGGQFNMSGLKFGLQFEDAEMGTLDGGVQEAYDIQTCPTDANSLCGIGGNEDGGKYLIGSVDYQIPNTGLLLGGWVAGYKSDIDDVDRFVDSKGNYIDEDAMSFAVGAKYFFSKRTMMHGGYLQVDSDNDFRDESVFGLGLRHSF